VKHKILIVEDDFDVAEMLNVHFRSQGYDSSTVHRGEEGIQACQTFRPDIVILDIRLPDIDGYEVARKLRGNRRTADIPIIFLTEKSDRSERLQGLEIGADDYISKPFDVYELRLRVRNALRRAEQDTLTNPVTGFPDGKLVNERISDYLHRSDWAMLIISLENLDSFRESYGFVASDDVLRAVSVMVLNTQKEHGSPEDFLGHLGPNDFIVITVPEQASTLHENIRSRLDRSMEYFYPIKDRDKPSSRSKKLHVKIGLLQSKGRIFTSLDDLKLSLLREKH
jgi:DNA-binding response OmpR family regulator